jgi:MFS family permease
MSAPAADRVPLWRMSGIQLLLESGAMLNSIAFFAAMPFASLYLSDHTHLSKPAIGAVVGAICLIAACGGFAGGALVDRFGATRLMRIGLLADVIVYGLLATVRSPGAIVALILMLGPARLLVEPAGKKLLSQAMAGHARAFRVRYMTLCVGAIAGPAIGGVLYHVSPSAFFAVPAVFYGAYMVLVTVRRRRLAELEAQSGAGAAAKGSLTTALRDRRLLAVVGAGIVIFIVFSQLESMIPLYIKGLYGNQGQSVYTALFITNAVLALAFQLPIDRVSAKLGRNVLIALGCVAFALSFVCFWASSASIVFLFAGIAIWTVGEGILLPMPDMAVHEIAGDNQKGVYFGLSDVRQAGFFFGPLVGGFLLGSNATVYFAVMGSLIFLCAPLLFRGSVVPVTTQESPEKVMADG